MLHWNTWWSGPTSRDMRTPDDLIALHTSLWEQWLDAHRSWWTMYVANLPTMPWPPAGTVAPPEPTQPRIAHPPEIEAAAAPRAARKAPPTPPGTPAGAGRPQHARKR